MSLATFQDAFSRALFSADLDPASIAQIPHLTQSPQAVKQFAAYRERALKGFAGILRDVYPTAAAVLGGDTFRAASDAFILQTQPRAIDPILIAEPFAQFLDLFSTEEKLPHIADVATLDYGCFKARQAIDATAMNTRIFTDLSPEQLAARRTGNRTE